MPPLHTLPEFCPKDLADWRRWLKKHHAKLEGVWLVFYKKASGKQGLTYSEAVDEALCWGWIDSKMNPIDEERYEQVYTPRKPGSVWSALNKRKIAAMEAQGRMQPAGRAKIDAAISDGSWLHLDGVEALEMPPELAQPLAANAAAQATYDALTRGRKKMLLSYLHSAKREETRRFRISKILEALSQGKMPAS